MVPIGEAEAPEAAEFLHRHLNPRISPERWLAVLAPPWADGPNRGFALLSGGSVVGVYAAIYSTRTRRGATFGVCNLAAFCVLEPYRAHSLRLVRALLGQKDLVFTDLSPSGNVPAMNERLGFSTLPSATRLMVCLPRIGGGARLTEAPDVIARTLSGPDAGVFADHHDAAAARHLVVQDGERYAYLVYRRDRRKRLPLFASPLYVGGDPVVLESNWGAVASHLLRRGYVGVLAERRVLGFTPRGWGFEVRHPRPKMFKGASDPEDIDYLYSELTLLEW
ncbi:hypothetical protein J2Y46_004073 [Microbacterium sp. BE35]|uniref:hypothetical protein n=1 Tax=Microbacterium sp. BE35 TaxID=2817773 RepID=UPI0028556BA5|nr:hypothetical protein [Microbacterium sp. BE35]MDR7191211.1 hypothetical protein [Microbacterium sp. BE35]